MQIFKIWVPGFCLCWSPRFFIPLSIHCTSVSQIPFASRIRDVSLTPHWCDFWLKQIQRPWTHGPHWSLTWQWLLNGMWWPGPTPLGSVHTGFPTWGDVIFNMSFLHRLYRGTQTLYDTLLTEPCSYLITSSSKSASQWEVVPILLTQKHLWDTASALHHHPTPERTWST